MLTQLHFTAIGFGHAICANKVYMLLSPTTKQAKRMIKAAKDEDRFLDACHRRSIKTLILMDDGKIIACPFSPKTTLARLMRSCGDYMSDIPTPNNDPSGYDDDYGLDDDDGFYEEDELEAEEDDDE